MNATQDDVATTSPANDSVLGRELDIDGTDEVLPASYRLEFKL